MNKIFENVTDFIKTRFPDQSYISLHEPVFTGNERKYVLEAIDSTYVSSVGSYVNEFESKIAGIAGTKYAVAIVNGTAALHMALIVAGVKQNDEVLSQALSFVATCNAISYIGAIPVFVDVDANTLGMSADKLQVFLENNAYEKNGQTYNKTTGRRISACVPMHTFGFPVEIDRIAEICKSWGIVLVEDAAESIGSYYKGKHTGSFGELGIFSFNGNKTVTCGGGGAIVTDNEILAKLAKHLTTQAKIPHKWEFSHDEVGYNYRMPNLNAAMACAQLEQLDLFVASKRKLAIEYEDFFKSTPISFVAEQTHVKANYWLNCLLLENRKERDDFLKFTNENGVMTRPAWTLMHKLTMFSKCEHDGLHVSEWIEDRLVNIPSSVRI